MQIKKLILAMTLATGFQAAHAGVTTTPAVQTTPAATAVDPTPEAIPDQLNLNPDAKKKDLSAKASAKSQDDTASLDELMNPVSKATTGVTDLRAQVVEGAAQTAGFQNGLAAEAKILIQQLNARSAQMDRIYQFNTLVQKNGVLPPVIVEARDLSAFSDDQIRTANRVYKIERPERFVSVPPSWRDYLYLGLLGQKPGDVNAATKPENSGELKIWQSGVKKGWKEGQDQAAAILKSNFNRLTRDFTGMMLYSTLRQQHIIDSTQVAELASTVTGNNKQLMLGDKHKRIVGKASFETNPSKWTPVLNRSSDLDEGIVTNPDLLKSNVTKPAN